ncbi:hypothetical protein PUR_35820 [Paenibacillus sp. URB8-2]|nr:hypothetical protein PUR_35820 [Paenibacillus sp. URB8-2]
MRAQTKLPWGFDLEDDYRYEAGGTLEKCAGSFIEDGYSGRRSSACWFRCQGDYRIPKSVFQVSIP